jgi:EAL domain-containing protein (putative c-di-GMP-specific phosphodiesterase class I)
VEAGGSHQKALDVHLSDIEQSFEKFIKNLLSKQSLHLNIPISAFEVNLKQNGLIENLSQVQTDELKIQKVQVKILAQKYESEMSIETLERLKRIQFLVVALASGNGHFCLSLLYYLEPSQNS